MEAVKESKESVCGAIESPEWNMTIKTNVLSLHINLLLII